jgi:hypothetical protein
MSPARQEGMQSDTPYQRIYTPAMRLRESLVAPLVVALIALLLTDVMLLGVRAYAPGTVGAESPWYIPVGALAFLFLAFTGVSIPVDRLLMRGMRDRLQTPLERRYGVDLSEAAYVGVSPYKDFGITDWDVGFLVVGPDAIRFYGERMSIQLMPGHIGEMKYGNGGVVFGYAPIQIVWREPSPLEYYTMNLRLRGTHSGRCARDLYRRISDWHKSALRADAGMTLPYAITQDSSPVWQPAHRFPAMRSALSCIAVTCLVAGMFVASIYLYVWTMRIMVGESPGIWIGVMIMVVMAIRAICEARAVGRAQTGS